MSNIVFDPDLSHVLGFRHGPRAALPPQGNAWDYYMGLSPKAADVAYDTVAYYIPQLVPAALRCSQIPRSSQTLALLFPGLIPQIKLDRRLGIEFEQIIEWAAIDAMPDVYNTTPQQQHAVCPDLVDKCGENFFNAARDLSIEVGRGNVGVMCSHMPIADAGARVANSILNQFPENDFWIPGSGFGSGAFVHFAFIPHSGALVHAQYYPVPTEPRKIYPLTEGL